MKDVGEQQIGWGNRVLCLFNVNCHRFRSPPQLWIWCIWHTLGLLWYWTILRGWEKAVNAVKNRYANFPLKQSWPDR